MSVFDDDAFRAVASAILKDENLTDLAALRRLGSLIRVCCRKTADSDAWVEMKMRRRSAGTALGRKHRRKQKRRQKRVGKGRGFW